MRLLCMPACIFMEFDYVTTRWKDSPIGGPIESRHEKRRRTNAAQKRALKAAGLHVFMQQYARKAQKRIEPNDRQYDRDIEQTVKRMDPVTLDRLLRDDEEDC
jgi:hypothetical protein